MQRFAFLCFALALAFAPLMSQFAHAEGKYAFATFNPDTGTLMLVTSVDCEDLGNGQMAASDHNDGTFKNAGFVNIGPDWDGNLQAANFTSDQGHIDAPALFAGTDGSDFLSLAKALGMLPPEDGNAGSLIDGSTFIGLDQGRGIQPLFTDVSSFAGSGSPTFTMGNTVAYGVITVSSAGPVDDANEALTSIEMTIVTADRPFAGNLDQALHGQVTGADYGLMRAGLQNRLVASAHPRAQALAMQRENLFMKRLAAVINGGESLDH